MRDIDGVLYAVKGIAQRSVLQRLAAAGVS